MASGMVEAEKKHPAALQLTGISKKFDGRPALDLASFEVRWGEIHSLLGENGAGKSTLMNVACGLYAPDEGRVAVNGMQVRISKPADAIRHGIGMVHQHYKLVERFTTAENLFLSCASHLGASKIEQVARAIIEKSQELELDVNPYARIADISVAEQQRVEILKMILAGARILILDEPTAVLTDMESENILSLLRTMAKDGCAVVLITHKLREILGCADRVTVMRAGQNVLTNADVSTVTRGSLAKAMVGEDIAEKTRPKRKLGKSRFEVKDLYSRDLANNRGVEGVSFQVKSGEIYGIAGIGGNGQTQLANALIGMVQPDSGDILLDGSSIGYCTVVERRAAGLRFIPADRFQGGIIADQLAYENFCMTKTLDGTYGTWMRLDRRKMRRDTARAIEEYKIRGCQTETPSRLLSGGNAQKLLLSRELDANLTVMIAHSPTRGLDVQACNVVYDSLLRAADKGAACMLISEDIEEVLALSSTVAVMSRGRIVGEFTADEVTREKIGELMLGHA